MPAYNAQLTPRDRAILLTLFECRIATYAHLSSLHFEGRFEAAKKRCQKLRAGGFIRERKRRISEPIILSLTHKSLDSLLADGMLGKYPGLALQDMDKRTQVCEATLKHELAVMDVRCAFFSKLGEHDRYRMTEFSTWPLLHSFQSRPDKQSQKLLVRPDGHLVITEPTSEGEALNHEFFLEVDRGTETLDTLVTRCLCYRSFYQGGGMAHWHGRPRHLYEHFPFRVLIVVPSPERRNNLAERLLMISPPLLSQIWLAVQTDVVADPLSAIWITPADYRGAVKGSEFELPYQSIHGSYRRRAQREVFVEQHVRRRPLL